MSGAFGEIASVSGPTITVTSPMAGEVSVTCTGSTELTDQVPPSAEALAAGACVQVTTEGDTNSVVATNVVISQPTDNECATSPGGADMSTIDGTPPAGALSGAPGGPCGLGATMGQVTAVDDSGFTITASTPELMRDRQASFRRPPAAPPLWEPSQRRATRIDRARPRRLRVHPGSHAAAGSGLPRPNSGTAIR